ncbi:ATP-grasp domain-containing protein [Streptomyces sp. NPDC002402]
MGQIKPAILLVDPVRNGAAYKSAVKDMGYAVVSLYSRRYSTAVSDHAKGDDTSLYAYTPDSAVDVLSTVDHDIRAVVPGMEAAVHLAGILADRLGLPGNDPSLAWARRNKAAMRERAREAGVRIPEFRLVHEVPEIAAAATEIGFPAIAKPTMGAGAHGTTLLPDAGALSHLEIPETRDIYDEPIREWLVEQYIRGREFSVNCLSSDGDHRVVDMWEYRQPDDRDYDFPIWDNVQIDRDHPDWHQVARFVHEVLTAYGIERGPSHTEVKVSADGVYLMEVGARLPGGPATEMWAKYSSVRPFHDSLECYLGKRPSIMDEPLGFRARYGALAIRNDEAPGTLVAIHGLDLLAECPGIDQILVDCEPGDHIPVTRSMDSIPVGAYVSGPDEAHVLRALATARKLVRLEITPDPAPESGSSVAGRSGESGRAR